MENATLMRCYTAADLVNFGLYLLSEKREARLKQSEIELPETLPYEERFRLVYDADLANWEYEQTNAN